MWRYSFTLGWSHILIDLYDTSSLAKDPDNTRLWKKGFKAISWQDKTMWPVWLWRDATSEKQIEHCVWVDHVAEDRWVVKTYLTVSWRDHSLGCWVTVARTVAPEAQRGQVKEANKRTLVKNDSGSKVLQPKTEYIQCYIQLNWT